MTSTSRTMAVVLTAVALQVTYFHIGPADAQEPTRLDYSAPRIDDGVELSQRQTLEALAASYRYASAVGYDAQGKGVLIARRADLFVVRFAPLQANVYDGEAEFTYDPSQGKIIKANVDG